jgi:hypothetical protein
MPRNRDQKTIEEKYAKNKQLNSASWFPNTIWIRNEATRVTDVLVFQQKV